MTNLIRKRQGAATLIMTVILLVSITLIVIFAAKYSVTQQKIISNGNRNQQAFEAAETGLEFGLSYLRQNSATILATKVSGYVQPYSDSNTTNVTLANGSKYSIVYSNPVANNYTLILITSTGTSDDGSATHTVSQQVQFGSILGTSPTNSLTAKGNVSLTGNSEIINTVNNHTVASGGNTSLGGSATTVTSGGTSSTASVMKSDIQQNVSSISSQSDADFFSTYFGLSQATVKSNANYTYSNVGDYSATLSGKTGSVIWIDQTDGNQATISGNVTIGSAASPNIIIVNGSLKLSGSAIIYGLVYVIGGETTDSTVTGNTAINGALISSFNLDLKGSTAITYNSTILNSIKNSVGNYWAKVPGTWKDF